MISFVNRLSTLCGKLSVTSDHVVTPRLCGVSFFRAVVAKNLRVGNPFCTDIAEDVMIIALAVSMQSALEKVKYLSRGTVL